MDESEFATPIPMMPDYDYFTTSPQERLPVLNKQIAEREEKLFELELAELSLEGNPAIYQTISHEDFATLIDQAREDAEKQGKKFVQQQQCPCFACQLEQVRDSKRGLIYSLNRLKALASTMTGKSSK